jgi:5-methylcytosine-specific restriction endonuclease McrA
MIARVAAFILIALLATDAFARDRAQRAAFFREHPCPSTGNTHGACPGWVVDHIVPLCAGGADDPSNMQWQELEASKEKDKDERHTCRELKKHTP